VYGYVRNFLRSLVCRYWKGYIKWRGVVIRGGQNTSTS
jgi:hypothetical protein